MREREKVTPSLRYDVMRRDNFRCQICGSTASDGVKLHVDHIVPVSKGGEYTKANIIPSCRSCNASKNNSDFCKWYKTKDFYSKDREEKIIKYLMEV